MTGNLNATDVDNPPDAWNAVGSATASVNGFGTFTLTAAGTWIYSLDNSNAAVQALNGAATLTDSFTVVPSDGTSQVVTVTISGAERRRHDHRRHCRRCDRGRRREQRHARHADRHRQPQFRPTSTTRATPGSR